MQKTNKYILVCLYVVNTLIFLVVLNLILVAEMRLEIRLQTWSKIDKVRKTESANAATVYIPMCLYTARASLFVRKWADKQLVSCL